ncbi:MAG: lysozyme [Cyanobacteria bacterium J06626_18]
MTVSFDGPEPPQQPPPPPRSPASSGGSSTGGSTSATGQINSDGLRIVKEFEGLELRAYQDSVGVWTIGYGHTAAAGAPDVYPGQTITEAQAEEILRRDLRKFEGGVRDVVKVPLTSDQFAALVSFSFNVGVGALSNSTLLRKLNARDYQGAANEFPRWVKAGGQTLQGLVRRRDAERALFLSQDYTRFL